MLPKVDDVASHDFATEIADGSPVKLRTRRRAARTALRSCTCTAAARFSAASIPTIRGNVEDDSVHVAA
jgi:hypothetical protein